MNLRNICKESDFPLAVTGSHTNQHASLLLRDGFNDDDFQGSLDRPDCIASGSHFISEREYEAFSLCVLRCSVTLN